MSVYWLTLLLLNGINVYPGRENKGIVKQVAAVYPWLISVFWMFITTSVLTSLVSQRTSYEETIEMLTYITGSSSTLALFAIGVYKRPQLNRMLHIVRHDFWHDERRAAAHTLYSRFVRTYGAVMPVANVMMCMAPIIWVANYGNMDSPAALIFRMWTPWTRLTPSKYAAAYTTQFVVSLSVLTSISGMVFAMVVFVNEMQVQVDMLTDAVRDLNVRDACQRPRAVFDNLVKCVKHHQTLITYFDHFKSYFNLLFVVDIVYIMIMTCLCASSVLLANGFSAFHIKMMSLLIIVVSQFFFYCLIGEKFSLMKPLQLTAMGISKYSASLFTFAVTMRSAYAGLNVLYNSTKNMSS
ncbi:Olfactory receptor, insect [Cinara cedri]|uniref:Odorant receptor n=1 Tax=Cinara cedri TaxID=506608 RepID=A0A5E4M130_9HEMI|nr:Olfactory receptor, insect [Cinara cedri]